MDAHTADIVTQIAADAAREISEAGAAFTEETIAAIIERHILNQLPKLKESK